MNATKRAPGAVGVAHRFDQHIVLVVRFYHVLCDVSLSVVGGNKLKVFTARLDDLGALVRRSGILVQVVRRQSIRVDHLDLSIVRVSHSVHRGGPLPENQVSTVWQRDPRRIKILLRWSRYSQFAKTEKIDPAAVWCGPNAAAIA